MNPMVTLAEYSVEEINKKIDKLIPNKKFYINLLGYNVKISSRIRMFYESAKCVLCAKVGNLYKLEWSASHPVNYIVSRCFIKNCSMCQWKSFRAPKLGLYFVDSNGHETEMTLDHIVPRSAGGTKAKNNIQTMCAPCNTRKASKCITTTLQHRMDFKMVYHLNG